jgi:hypothetical protein
MTKRTPPLRSWLGVRPGDFALGSVQSRAAVRAMQLGQELEAEEQLAALLRDLTPAEQAFIEIVDEPDVKALLLRIYREVIVPRNEVFGVPLPTP